MFNYDQIDDLDIKERFKLDFYDELMKVKQDKNFSEIVILCVGTDRITGDCFGPIVGSKLKELLLNKNYSNIDVYGTLDNNLNYNNINQVLKRIKRNSCLIIIDAALSKKDHIGKLFVSNNKTILGKSISKNNIEIGDLSIKAVVGKDYKIPMYNFKALQNISLNTIIKIADIVSEGIYEVISIN